LFPVLEDVPEIIFPERWRKASRTVPDFLYLHLGAAEDGSFSAAGTPELGALTLVPFISTMESL